MNDQITRQQLLEQLTIRRAHMSLEDAVTDFPESLINTRPPNVSYTFWHLLEHIRIAQADILDFILNPDYQSPSWPADYWPPVEATTDAAGWQRSLDQFQGDAARLAALVQDENVDLYEDLPHAPGYSILREILVVTDHNAYHIGELAILRQVLDTWPPGHE